MAQGARIIGVLITSWLSQISFGQDPTTAPGKPGNAEAWYKRAYDRRHNKDFDGAIADATEAIKLSPKTGKYWLERGISKGNKSDLEGALEDFNQAVLLAPENADALRIRGNMKARRKDFDGALDDFAAAVRISPKFSRAYGDRGDTYRQMGKIDLALADYSRALEIDKKYFWFCESRGDILRSQGKLDGAASDYRSALETAQDEAVRNRLLRKLASLPNTASPASDWTQPKFDARRSGNVPDRDVGDSLGLLAAVPMTDAILTSPAVAGGKIYVVDASGRAACIDATTFKVIWQFESRGGLANCNNVSSPALAGNYLHFGTMAGSWYVLDAARGTVVREHRVGEPVFASPVVAKGRVYFATLGSRVYSLTADGSLQWTWDFVKEELKFEGDRWSGESWLKFRNAKLRQGDQFLCPRDLAASDRHLVVPAGGSLVWLEDLGDHAQAHDVHLRSAPTYGLTMGEDGSAYRQWSYLDNEGQVERVALSGTELYAGPGDGLGTVPGTESSWFGPGLANLSGFASVSLRGAEVFRTRPQDGYGLCRHLPGHKEPDRLHAPAATASPILLRNSVVYGDLGGSLHVVPLAPGRAAWSFRTPFGKAITAPAAAADGRIYFGSDDGYLYVLGPGGRASPPDKELDLWKIRSPRAATLHDRFTSFGDFANANASDDGLKPPFRLKWVRRFEGTVKHLSTFGGGRMYTHTAEGQIFAVEEETGRLLWRAYYPGTHLSYTSALYHRERLLVPQAGPESCRLRSLEAATGKLLWEAPFEGSPGWTRESPPVVLGNLAFYAFGTGTRSVGARQTWLFAHDVKSFPEGQRPMVRAYDLESGKTVWERDFSEDGWGGDEAGLCLVEGRLAYSCFFGRSPIRDGKPGAQGITALLDPLTGKEIWRTTKYSVRGGCGVSAKDGRLYLSGKSPSTGPDGHHVWCVDAQDGSLVWKSDPLLAILNVVTIGSRFVHVHAQYQEGYLLDKSTGKTLSVIKHAYKCTRFTLSDPYLLGPNLDVLDLSEPRAPRLVATGPRLDPTECVASVVSGGRLFYTALAGGLQISEVFGPEAERWTPSWAER